MSEPVYDIDEGLWQLYLIDCQVNEIAPSITDYLVWCDEHDYDRPETFDGEWGETYER